MNRLKITARNYRCFDESNPLVLELGVGFTALVGSNNAGKSTVLRFIYELRSLWTHLSANLPRLGAGGSVHVDHYPDVPDPQEMFFDGNQNPLRGELELLAAPSTEGGMPNITKIVFSCNRDPKLQWNVALFSGEDQLKTKGAGYIDSTLIDLKNEQRADARTILDALRGLAATLYIGPFRNAVNQGAGTYYDLNIGTSFVSTWNSWKSGDIKKQRAAIGEVNNAIKRIFEYEQLEINASASGQTLSVYVNGKPYRLPELGAGLAQFIVVLGNAAIRRPPLILIDEPELNLHPALQIDFLTSLASFSENGIIFATHSIGLARATAERIYSLQKTTAASTMKAFEETPNYTEFVGELSFSSFKDLGHNQILLVEGVSDVKTVQQFLRIYQKDHKIVLLPLGGSQLIRGDIEQELRELMRLCPTISALIDSEKQAEDAPLDRSRKAFVELCARLGINVLVTRRRALENYISHNALTTTFGASVARLGAFQSLKGTENAWAKADTWKAARLMSKDDIHQSDVGEFIDRL